MPLNDTWRGRDAHQGLAEGLGPWRVGWFLYKVQLGVTTAFHLPSDGACTGFSML